MKFIEFLLESNFTTAIVDLIGGVWTSKFATCKAQRIMKKKGDVFEKSLEREYQILIKLEQICTEILVLMERFVPDRMSLHLINDSEQPTLKELALKVEELKKELKSSTVINADISIIYEEILAISIRFLGDIVRYKECSWDKREKEDVKRMEKLRVKSYDTKEEFEKKLNSTREKVRGYLKWT